jgi:FAD/FMN-containing dehydrogenase
VATPLLRLPVDPLYYAFNLIRLPATDDVAETDRLLAANRAVYDRVAAAGGTLYPASAALPLSGDDWRRHFGPALARLGAAKRRYDPANVLRNGYEIP